MKLAVATVELEGLSEAETASLVSARQQEPVEPDLILRLRERTGGNPPGSRKRCGSPAASPSPVGELADSALLHKSVPKAIEVLVERRLSGLGEVRGRCWSSLRSSAASSISDCWPPSHAALSRTSRTHWKRPIRDGIIVDVPGFAIRFAFFDGLSLYDRQKPSDRQRRHARCGETLEARYANSPPHAAELAHHFFHARSKEKALRYSRGSGMGIRRTGL